MVLLRRVIGDALRARRQGQHRTLREVSTAANVSLGYLSEIERGQKEASSELLGSICDALGAQLSDVLREVSDTLALAEQMEGVLVPAESSSPASARAARTAKESAAAEPVAHAGAARMSAAVRRVATDGKVSVSVHQDSPLKATLRAKRAGSGERGREVVFAA